MNNDAVKFLDWAIKDACVPGTDPVHLRNAIDVYVDEKIADALEFLAKAAAKKDVRDGK